MLRLRDDHLPAACVLYGTPSFQSIIGSRDMVSVLTVNRRHSNLCVRFVKCGAFMTILREVLKGRQVLLTDAKGIYSPFAYSTPATATYSKLIR